MGIKVIHYEHEGADHNWEVFRDGETLGSVHCDEKGKDFGGSFYVWDEHEEIFDIVENLCMSDLADLYLLDRFLTKGY